MNRRKNILDAVFERRDDSWSDSTKETARSDAYRVLEALVSKLGVEDVIAAMDHQGFDGAAYRYLVVPLHEEAVSRRPPFEEDGG